MFEGTGEVQVGGHRWAVQRGDLRVVPAWQPLRLQAAGDGGLDLFRFSDAPIFEALHGHRVQVDDAGPGTAGATGS